MLSTIKILNSEKYKYWLNQFFLVITNSITIYCAHWEWKLLGSCSGLYGFFIKMSRMNNLIKLNLNKNLPRGIRTSEILDFSIYDPLVKNLPPWLDFTLFNIRKKILDHMKLKIIKKAIKLYGIGDY